MQSMRIRALLASPVASPGSRELHIDGLLAWSMVYREVGDSVALTRRCGISDLSFELDDLGLATAGVGENAVTLSTSWHFPDCATLGSTYVTRRRTESDTSRRERRIDPSSPDRPSISKIDCIYAPFCEWHAYGDMGRIADLLSSVESIGGLRGAGYGCVKNWSIEGSSRSRESMLVYNGIAQRNLPECIVRSELARRVAVRPPYWLPALSVQGVEPGSPAELSEQVLLAIG